MKRDKLTKEEISWSMYDFSSSAFTMLLTAIIPVYIKSVGHGFGVSDADSTAQWGLVLSISTLLLALFAPVIGAFADFRGNKKKIFSVFFALSMVTLFAMIFVNDYYTLLIINFILQIGYAGTYIVYDAFLVDVTLEDRMHRVSSFGFASGYLGSCIPFVAGLAFILLQPFGMDSVTAVKISFAITLGWWFFFSLPMIRNVRQKYYIEEKPKNVLRESLKNMAGTFKKITKDKNMAFFLLAFFFYIDGVNTIITMCTDFGADVGIDTNSMIIALLFTQIVAAVFVLAFSRILKTVPVKRVIMVCIVIFAGVSLAAFFMTQAWHFWVIAFVTAIALGAIQALSRSYFARMIPDKTHNNEYFGFYNILTRYSSVLGPLIVALLTWATGASRFGALGIMALFVVGFLIFSRIPSEVADQPHEAKLEEVPAE